MSRFIDFLTENRGGDSTRPSLTQSQHALTVGVARELGEIKVDSLDALTAVEAKEAAGQIGALAYSPAFLQEFSDAIGTPAPGETEDQFVARCKAQMASLLRARFKK